jgi:hypothetical protein
MKNIDDLITNEIEKQFRAYVVRNLVDALMVKFQITQGSGLAMLIGECFARDNRQAIQIFVERELPLELGRNSQEYLELLAEKLADKLRRIKEGTENF